MHPLACLLCVLFSSEYHAHSFLSSNYTIYTNAFLLLNPTLQHTLFTLTHVHNLLRVLNTIVQRSDLSLSFAFLLLFTLAPFCYLSMQQCGNTAERLTTMRLFLSNKCSSSVRATITSSRPSRFLSSTNKSMSWSLLSTLVILSVLLLTSFTPSAQVSAAAGTGFCGDCQTFAYAIAPCGSTFTSTDIEINGTYIPPQSASKCICSDTMQKVLWACARCELLAFGAHSQPPQAYQTQCIAWGMTAAEWTAAYTGTIAPGTSAITGSTTGATTTAVTGTTTVAVGTATTTTAAPVAASSGTTTNGTLTGTAAALPSGSSDSALSGGTSESSGGPNGTAIGISVGIIGVAAVAGAIAVFMMKRNRRRHEPLELDGTYVGLDDQWEKPRPQSPPMMPAPIASGAPIASRGPMQSGHRPSPFESRPGGGGSVAGGYDGQYDQYDQYDQQYDHNYAHHQGGGGGGYEYNHGGYQGYEYGYENTVPTSGPYHGGNGSDGGHYQ